MTIEFGRVFDIAVNAQVLALQERLGQAALHGVIEAVPTLRSLTVHYDSAVTSSAVLREAISGLLDDLPERIHQGRRWELPACYAAPFGLDLAEVARRSGLSEEEVIRLHAASSYRVLMLGFLPGFPYMGELASQLQLPRLRTPRAAVPGGSVAIATGMTVVYPVESPGGWHILARTPALLFDPRRDDPVLLAPADEVRFNPVGLDEFNRLERGARDGTWRPQPLTAVSEAAQ